MKKILFVCLMLMLGLSTACADFASPLAAQMVDWTPGKTLNMRSPFAPIALSPDEFRSKDPAWLSAYGLSAEEIAGLSRFQKLYSEETSAGEGVTVLFYEEDGTGTAAVFERTPADSWFLVDILFNVEMFHFSAQVVQMGGETYLLTNETGSGTGCSFLRTDFYHLEQRRAELSILREGFDSDLEQAASCVTHTNVDHFFGLNGVWGENDGPLAVYSYISLSDLEAEPGDIQESACLVRLYDSTADGLRLSGERVFPAGFPSELEKLRPEVLFSSEFKFKQGEKQWTPGAVSAPKAETGELSVLLTQALPQMQVSRTDWVNLRAAPDKQSESIGIVKAGERVLLLSDGHEVHDGWSHVLFLPAGGSPRIGYIWCGFLEAAE